MTGDGYVSGACGANLTGKEHYFVRLSGGSWVLAGAGTDFGVLIDITRNRSLSSDGLQCTVCQQGPTTVIAGGTISAGDRLVSDASGTAVAASSGDTSYVIAKEAGVAGDYVNVLCSYVPRGYVEP